MSVDHRPAAAAHPISVVLADDTEDIRLLTRLVLERSGRFEVVGEAENGKLAIDQAAAHQPEVLLLDLAMPVMDGLAAIPHVRRAAPATKIIILSGFEKSTMAEEALRLGAVSYLQKGLHKDDLVQEILEACGAEGDSIAARRDASPAGTSSPATGTRAGGVSRSRPPVGSITSAGAARAAHELRSPLTTIIGGAQTLHAHWEALDPDSRSTLLEAIVRQGKRMERLIDDLLTMSRLDAGTFALRIEDHPVAAVIDAAVAGGASDGPSLEVHIAGRPIMRADGDRVVQMLDNLLRNAMRYGRPPVVITARQDGDVVTIGVRDHGDGVPADMVDDLFTRWSPAATGCGGSVGLGLSIVRELAEAHGGSVDYEAAPGGGALFTLTLPALRQGPGGDGVSERAG